MNTSENLTQASTAPIPLSVPMDPAEVQEDGGAGILWPGGWGLGHGVYPCLKSLLFGTNWFIFI